MRRSHGSLLLWPFVLHAAPLGPFSAQLGLGALYAVTLLTEHCKHCTLESAAGRMRQCKAGRRGICRGGCSALTGCCIMRSSLYVLCCTLDRCALREEKEKELCSVSAFAHVMARHLHGTGSTGGCGSRAVAASCAKRHTCRPSQRAWSPGSRLCGGGYPCATEVWAGQGCKAPWWAKQVHG